MNLNRRAGTFETWLKLLRLLLHCLPSSLEKRFNCLYLTMHALFGMKPLFVSLLLLFIYIFFLSPPLPPTPHPLPGFRFDKIAAKHNIWLEWFRCLALQSYDGAFQPFTCPLPPFPPFCPSPGRYRARAAQGWVREGRRGRGRWLQAHCTLISALALRSDNIQFTALAFRLRSFCSVPACV